MSQYRRLQIEAGKFFSLLTAAAELSEHTACAKSRRLSSRAARSLTRFCTPYGTAPLLKPAPLTAQSWSMIPKKPAPGLTRGGSRFSEKIMLQQKVRL